MTPFKTDDVWRRITLSKGINITAPEIGLAEQYAVLRVLKSGILANGPKVTFFEEQFSKMFDLGDCVAVNSGTSALHLALLSLGIGPGDEVIVPAFTFAATANCVTLTGATPIFADVDSRTFNIDVSSAEQVCTSRTKAIIPVHLFGLPADMDRVNKFAKSNDLFVIEDAAQAHGAIYKSRSVGSFGDAAAFSFYATKNMTSGEGGMIAVSRTELSDKLRLLRNQGMRSVYEYEIAGFNNRMSEIQAALGIVQLAKLEKLNRARISNATFYNSELKGVTCPEMPEGYKHVYHQYVITIEDLSRDRFADELKKNGIESKVYYPQALNKINHFFSSQDLKISESLANKVLAIPVHPKLKTRDLEKIVKTVNYISKFGT